MPVGLLILRRGGGGGTAVTQVYVQYLHIVELQTNYFFVYV